MGRGQGRVQEVDLPSTGATWLWRVREEEGGVWGNLPPGALGKETWSLVALVTKME